VYLTPLQKYCNVVDIPISLHSANNTNAQSVQATIVRISGLNYTTITNKDWNHSRVVRYPDVCFQAGASRIQVWTQTTKKWFF